MELQWPFIERLLETYPRAEYHVWNLTRNESDNCYVRALEGRHERIKVFNHLWPGDNKITACRKRQPRMRFCNCVECRPAPFEEVYRWYAEAGERVTATSMNGDVVIDEEISPYDSTVFVKLDDDIVFIETERFGEVLDLLAAKPTAVVSANVVNNVVSAKHDPDLRVRVERQFRPQTFKSWFDLHADHKFARTSHDWFLTSALGIDGPLDEYGPTKFERCLPGEKPSINFIAMHYPTLKRVNKVVQEFHDRLGDEGAINHNFLPWITVSFHVAHLYFGPQRIHMDDCIEAYREAYRKLGADYLKRTKFLEAL